MMSSSPVEERNFYLTLSILEGQKLAHAAGFSVPSADVQEHEIMDTMQKWFTLSHAGILDSIKECANWMINILRDTNDMDDETLAATENIITAFGVAAVAHLVDQEMLNILEPENYDPSLVETNIVSLLGYMLTSALSDEDDDLDLEEGEEDEQ